MSDKTTASYIMIYVDISSLVCVCVQPFELYFKSCQIISTTGAFEHENLKKELRHVKGKWEEDKKLKSKLEDKLQYQHAKIMEIATTLEQFEHEFQVKDATIIKLDLELRQQVSKKKIT